MARHREGSSRCGNLIAILVCVGVIMCGITPSIAQRHAIDSEDPNVDTTGLPPAESDMTIEALSGTVTATFPGPLAGFSINLTIVNNTESRLRTFILSGRFIRPLPIIWDSIGTFSSASGVTLKECTGVDTDTVVCSFSGFDPGRSVTFSSIDPDYEGDPSAGITVADLAGVRSIVVAGGVGFGKFAVSGDNVVATIQ